MSCKVLDGHFQIFIFSESKVYAIYIGETHFQIRGLMAELHVFEYGGWCHIRHFWENMV